MHSFEKLGLFYLGRRYDPGTRQRAEPLLYDSRDLVTHAVCIGMTGSGKTGLGIDLIEEAAIDGIPVVAVDPKGDLGNLLLTFRSLSAEAFRPWIDEDDARRQGLEPAEFARREAERWRDGLAAWGQDGERIGRLRSSAEFAIYTPGSTAGLPLSILQSFAAPPAMRDDAERWAERLDTVVTSILTLVGIEEDPLQSRDHLLLSAVLDHAWRQDRSLDLAGLIEQVQNPAVSRVGVLELESFYPAAERFRLAMRLNWLLAAPGSEVWRQGPPLSFDTLLYGPDGHPRVSIVSIAHLDEMRRMSVMSLLANEATAWMRRQSGTTSLRALLYIDEVGGYVPPVANPASKRPLLTLLKQGRAFGLGIVLATQNPVDLDYKSLSNAGTWLLGRLQTERDRERVLDGLEKASVGGQGYDRAAMDGILGSLDKRIFLLHSVHQAAPVVFETRWTLSYLRGPLTRDQIRDVMATAQVRTLQGAPGEAAPHGGAASSSPDARSSLAVVERADSTGSAARPPLLPPDVPQYFLRRPGKAHPDSSTVLYRPMLYASAHVEFRNRTPLVSHRRHATFLFPLVDGGRGVHWDGSTRVELDFTELLTTPPAEGRYAALPAAAARAASYTRWGRAFARWVQRAESFDLREAPAAAMVSEPGEGEREFRIRVHERLREGRDEATAQLRAKYGKKTASLVERARRAEQAVARESEQASHTQLDTVVSLGATVLGALLGRKAASAGTLGRATTAARGVGRSYKQRQDVRRAEETLSAVRRQIAALDAALEREIAELTKTYETGAETIRTLTLTPARGGVALEHLALVWVSE